MRNARSILTLFIINFLLAQYCFADCTGGGFSVWPHGEMLLPNQQIMLEGNGREQEIARLMGKDYIACLWSGIDQVELRVVEVCEGQWGLTQAVLQPVTKLVVGRTYQLLVEKVNQEIGVGRAYGPCKEWAISSKSNYQAPKWKSAPKEIGKHLVGLGCGDDVWVTFRIDAVQQSMLRVKAQVKTAEGKHWTAYYLPLVDGKINIGHTMCAGEFDIQLSPNFEAKFTLVNPIGDMSEYPGPSIKFSPPRETTID